jgi:hypothetical protein
MFSSAAFAQLLHCTLPIECVKARNVIFDGSIARMCRAVLLILHRPGPLLLHAKSNVADNINTSEPDGKYMYHLFQQSVILLFVFICFVWFSL